jgi:protein O-GlcNAc transferase
MPSGQVFRFSLAVARHSLNAVGLLDLIVDSLKDFEAHAIALANNPVSLSELKAKLARNRETYPLFDTARFTRNLERAFETMWRRGQAVQPPETFSVETDLQPPSAP